MAYIFTHIYADIAPELRAHYFKGFGSTTVNFSSLLTNICTLTGANFVDGDNPKLHGSWHSIKDSFDLLTSLVLQQNINSLLPGKQNSLTIDSFQFERPAYTQSKRSSREPEQLTRTGTDISQLAHVQDTAKTVNQLQNDGYDSYASSQDNFSLTAANTNLETASSSRPETNQFPLSDCDQTNDQSKPCNTTRNVVIDFQDVNFETFKDFDHDQQKETLEGMYGSDAPTTIHLQIKQEYADESYTQEAHTSNIIVGHESPEQQSMLMVQNEGLSMQMGECESGGKENFLENSSQMPSYSTVSPMVIERAQESSGRKTGGKNNWSQKSGSNTGNDTKLTQMYVKETSERGLSFVCINCKYNSHCLKNIEDHVRRNHSERLFHCKMCSTKFGLKRDLKRHYKVKHYVIIDNNQKQNVI